MAGGMIEWTKLILTKVLTIGCRPAIEYERLTRQGKPIPRKLQKRMDEASNWLNNLSDEEHSRLIH